jgi:type I restriction enzyme S subunit
MAIEWQDTTLKTLLSFSNGKTSPDRADDLPFPVYGSNGVIGRSREVNASENSIIIGRVGSYCGSVYLSRSRCWVTDNAIRAEAINGNEPRYLYYLLESLNLNNWRGGSGQPLLNQTILNSIEVSVPSPAVQRRIADVLGKLDDKIELNRRMNRTLEKMAAAIFKSWFIDFDPVHAKAEGRDPGLPAEIADLFPESFEDSALGPIPKGWDVKPLDEIADYLNGLACQKHPPVEGQKSLPVIKIRELRQGITNNTDRASVDVPPKYIVEDGDVLFSWSGSLLVSIWCSGRGVLNQHVFKVTSASFPKWYFYQATKHHLDEFQRIASDKATTMGHIKRHHLTDAKMAIPGEELMAKGTEVLGTMLDRRINALKQARILALARDTLLPKLLSGEIELPEAEERVEGVT